MAYRIFLTDGIDTAEMDTENIDTKTIFALLDLQDIGSKKNDIQTLTFKGTKKNNEAFGSFFDFSRESNVSFTNNLFFNYNPLKAVKTYVYEDTELIFVGDLRLSEINVDVNGVVIYNCIVATNLTLLKTALSDKYLANLDFNFMQHRYCWNTIYNSWVEGNNAPELYDSTTDTYTQTNQGYGVGYCYPLADYGYRFNATTSTWSGNTIQATNIISLRNLKPAVFVRQYLDSIFGQSVLSGYTYEIKGSTGFTNMFNQIVIPETNEITQVSLQAISATTTQQPTGYTYNFEFTEADFRPGDGSNFLYSYVNVPNITNPTNGNFYFTGYTAFSKTIGLKSLRTIKTSINLEIDVDITTYPYPPIPINKTTTVDFLLKQITSTSDVILVRKTVTRPYNSTGNFTDELYIQDVEISKGDVIYYQFKIVQALGAIVSPNIAVELNYNKLKLSLPGKQTDNLIYNIEPNITCSEENTFIPTAPVNVKQLDFLKSIINQFNFVVYTEKNNYKHFIFELYDDFYVRTLPQYLITNSLDWTNKIDYTRGLQIKPNIELPKSYLYTYKSDVDYLNVFYKNKFNEIYGQFSFNDELGLVDQKKIELLFSPTVMTTINGIMKPLYYIVQNNTITPNKINPRIVYYNGYQLYDNTVGTNFGSTYIGYEENGTTGITTLLELDNYPQISNYYLTNLYSGSTITGYTVQNDIHFNQPREIYYINTNNNFNVSNLSNSYQNYFINQITELTDENVIFVECDVYLSEFDIGNLDLSVPVYIQTGNNNGAYFKIINVEYENKDLPSKVKLQKIVI
jgi:hypothetical protein